MARALIVEWYMLCTYIALRGWAKAEAVRVKYIKWLPHIIISMRISFLLFSS